VVLFPQTPKLFDERVDTLNLPVQPLLVHLLALRVARPRALLQRAQRAADVVLAHERVRLGLGGGVRLRHRLHVHRANDGNLRAEIRRLLRQGDVRARHALDLQAQIARERSRLRGALRAV
jgi:hypothetical protein